MDVKPRYHQSMPTSPENNSVSPHPSPGLTVGRRRQLEHSGDPRFLEEDALRALLMDDPNNEEAFLALVDLVAENSAHQGAQEQGEESDPGADPLAAHQERQGTQESKDDEDQERRLVAMWALAEEFAGHPRGWYPMILMARLSLATNAEDSLRRLNAGISRDDTGQALARSIDLLRNSERAQEAYALGAGHWRSRDHHPVAGVAVIRAALDCGKTHEARGHLDDLLSHYTAQEIADLDPLLQEAVDAACPPQESDSSEQA